MRTSRRSFLAMTGAWLGAGAAAQADGEGGEPMAVPPFPIVDTHVHFWDPANLDYPWLKGSELLNKPYLPRTYTEAIGGVEVEKIVFVEAACAPQHAAAEVEWVSGLAEKDGRIQGIVACAPLQEGDSVRPMLEAYAKNPLVKGIRPRFPAADAVSEDFVKGVKHVAAMGLTCDICTGASRLPEALEVVRACPEGRFMLDHIGVPNLREGGLEAWRANMRAMAGEPHVWCKMSGVATCADPAGWTREDLAPAIAHVFECFGVERTAFGSDWPVMLKATAYPRWVDALLWAVRDCSPGDLRQLFRDTAIGFYRLPG